MIWHLQLLADVGFICTFMSEISLLEATEHFLVGNAFTNDAEIVYYTII